MKKNHLVFFLLLASLCILSNCKPKHDSKNIENCPNWFSNYSFFDKEDYYDFFENKINSLSDSELIFANTIKQFYLRAEAPIWTRNGYQEQHIADVMTFLSNSEEHGLSPKLFRCQQIQDKIRQIRALEIDEAEDLYAALAQLELQITESYILYANILSFGATDPVEVNGGKWLHQTAKADEAFVASALQASDTAAAYLRHLQPQDSNYTALQRELKQYLSLKSATFPKIPQISGSVGQKNVNFHLIGERLKMTHEIDSLYQPSDTLSRTLMRAINNFRIRHAIPVSHELDAETIDALNRPPQYYIDKLSANLERYRWKVIPAKGSAFIAVNVADFTLQAYCADTLAIRMRVCCGKYPKRTKSLDSCLVNGLLPAQKSETPLLHSEINFIALNPEWNIPYSILKDEYYPKLVRSNTHVIHKEKLKLIDNRTKKEVLPETVNWKKINRKNIPYRLAQTSGAHNALGKFKFSFPNTESVYIHDTNLKSAFKRRVRALSHGCVRIEMPLELATLILLMNEYTEEEMEQVMIILGEEPTTEEGIAYLEKRIENEQKYFESLAPEDTIFYHPLRPTNLHLKKKMPVFIEYFTCFLGESGIVQYRPDIYCKEQNVLTCLKRLEK